MLQAETMITEGKKLTIVNPINVMGINATKLFKANQNLISKGHFVNEQKSPDSDSLFSFLSLGDGTIVMGKIKDGTPIFERYSMN
jgi:hypothetical protein